MTRRAVVALLLLGAALHALLSPREGGAAGAVQPVVRHELSVSIDPAGGGIRADDTLTIPESFPSEFRFLLHRGLDPTTPTAGVSLTMKEAAQGGRIYDIYTVKLPAGRRTFAVRYGGTIRHAVMPVGKEYARGFGTTPGTISDEGVYLAGSSFWYPRVENETVSFSLEVAVPLGWAAVSQGGRVRKLGEDGTPLARWESPEPQDEIYLVAGRFTEYSRPFNSRRGVTLAMVLLRSADRDLAERYLEATVRYVTMYEELIGTYPYVKFALVENFWETGFGMPSFTLLGPKIIRFPFIIVSSYPHEILHNWWGNGVYPDYGGGNWTEGLTAYLADHLLKEQQGAALEYRETTLQKYADYVRTERDFPLAGFTSRHSSPSEAVGYGKSLMFFHMLRRELGDEAFTRGLREFYRANLFRTASFDDLRRSFEQVSGRDLAAYFDQWIGRAGAPELRIGSAKAVRDEGGYRLTVLLEQVQPGAPYLLRVPLAVTMEGRREARVEVVSLSSAQAEVSISLPSQPLRVDADPGFDLFRRLDQGEIPPALSQALGARKMTVVLPARAAPDLLAAYRHLAGLLQGSGPDVVEMTSDGEIGTLPPDRAVVIMGWENRFLGEFMSSLAGRDVVPGDGSLRIGKRKIPRRGHSVVLTSRQRVPSQAPTVFIAADDAGALPGLGRKLPHYHRYSYLAFEGDEPENVLKGRWPVVESPLTIFVPDEEGRLVRPDRGGLAPREPLIRMPAAFSADRMMESVKYLSGSELGGRGFGSKGLETAADYIARQFVAAGLAPSGEGGESFFQAWQAEGGDPKRVATQKNVVGVIPGGNERFAGESVVVGAHYDHLGLGWPDVRGDNRGKVHPGADDNASGVAVLIELARALAKGPKPARSILFVAFAGEEAGRLGSKHYVSADALYPARRAIAMVNIDTVGRLGKGKLLALGAQSAREWVHILRGAGFVTGLEIDAVTEELDSSDQVSFIESGIPAIQLFTGPHADYHRPTDTADRIDREGLVRVAAVAKEVAEYLSKRPEPLTSADRPAEAKSAPSGRKSSLGTVPDFSHAGNGVRLSGVMAGSPAERAGLKAGDVIVRLNGGTVGSLRDLSEALKALEPGSAVRITFLREEKEMSVETSLDPK